MHKLRVLANPFAELKPSKQERATWAENWVLQWSPESEIRLVESTLFGETINEAVGFVIKERLEKAPNIVELSYIISDAQNCGLPELFTAAVNKLKDFATTTTDFTELAETAINISSSIAYGSLRKINADALKSLLTELFYSATLQLPLHANCNTEVAPSIMKAISQIQYIADNFPDNCDITTWKETITEFAKRDDKQPLLSGYCHGILLEKNQISPEEVKTEVSRRLSPAVPADLGAGWFEGVLSRNKYAVISRKYFWEALNEYVLSLAEEHFIRALVFLRRAFSTLNSSERGQVGEVVTGLLGVSTRNTEHITGKLSKDEVDKLKAIDEFTFDDV